MTQVDHLLPQPEQKFPSLIIVAVGAAQKVPYDDATSDVVRRDDRMDAIAIAVGVVATRRSIG